MPALDLKKFSELARAGAEAFKSAEPYPHVVLDGLFDPKALDAVLEEFEASRPGWKHYRHYNEKKKALTDFRLMGPATRALITELQSPAFLAALESLTGVRGLLSDPALEGGGLHETNRGGFLNVHSDFLSHTVRKHWSRQINLLLFLNKDWDDSYEGCLELWDKKVKRRVQKIRPDFNRCVLFLTRRDSFHGVPEKLTCPEDRSRKSIALYYYKDEGETRPLDSTFYKARPGDSAPTRAFIALDRALLRGYSFLKRYCGVADSLASRILKYF